MDDAADSALLVLQFCETAQLWQRDRSLVQEELFMVNQILQIVVAIDTGGGR